MFKLFSKTKNWICITLFVPLVLLFGVGLIHAEYTNFPNGITSFGVPITRAINPFGDVWFVAASGGGDGSGNSGGADAPFATIAYAISRGAAGDTILLGPGTHSVDVSSAALVPKADMQFVAAILPLGGKPSTIVTHDADDGAVLVTVDVDGVGFYGIEFLMVTGSTTAVDLFDVAQTTAVTGLIFKDCWFDLNEVDHATAIVRALALDDGTNAITGLVVSNCRFLGGDATTTESEYVVVGVGGIPGALIEDNVFMLESADATTVAIAFADPGAVAGSYGWVCRNNDFIGPSDIGGDAVAITFTGAMTEGEIMGIIRTNYFSYCNTSPITIDEVNKSIIWNYYGDDATGGVLADPGT